MLSSRTSHNHDLHTHGDKTPSDMLYQPPLAAKSTRRGDLGRLSGEEAKAQHQRWPQETETKQV